MSQAGSYLSNPLAIHSTGINDQTVGQCSIYRLVDAVWGAQREGG